MTIEEIQSRIRNAETITGERFAFTLRADGRSEGYVTRWFRPDPHAFEDCQSVASGTVAECVAALDRYVAERAPVPAMAAE